MKRHDFLVSFFSKMYYPHQVDVYITAIYKAISYLAYNEDHNDVFIDR